MEQTQYNVSVIIPVYNAQKFLDRCVRSVLEQTLPEVEVILVDDGSTDESGRMCDAYAAWNSRVQVLHLENGGPARARNQGIRIAKGTYIGFVDSDDYVDQSMFEKLYEAAQRTDSDIAMCNYAVETTESTCPATMNYRPLYTETEIKTDLIQRYYTGDHSGLYSMCNKLFRRSFIWANSLEIDETLRRGEDAWFIFECLKVARVVSYLPEVLYYYYQNSDSIMHTLSADQFQKWTFSRKKLLEENQQLQFDIDYNQFYGDYLYKTAIFCREMVHRGDIALVKSVLADAFFLRTIVYRANLPAHIRFLLWLTENNHNRIAVMMYRIYGLRK